MGFTGELVRSVFSRNRSAASHESKVRHHAVDNRRWVSVKSYLCGEEFNSVLAEEDSASVKSSEATVMQPMQEVDLIDKENAESEETVENVTEKRPDSDSTSLNEEEAAILIQSAFRGFMLRRRNEENRSNTDKEELNLVTESPDTKSLGTSVEVLTANSAEVFSVDGEKLSICHSMQRRTRTHVTKQKEEWDDSTVSSYVSKMRMQNRMEATTRRERALAFSQLFSLKAYAKTFDYKLF